MRRLTRFRTGPLSKAIGLALASASIGACGSAARPLPRVSKAKTTSPDVANQDQQGQTSEHGSPASPSPGSETPEVSPTPAIRPTPTPEPSYSLAEEMRESIADSLERIDRLAATLQQTEDQIAKTEAINETFCGLRREHLETCPALGSLMPSLFADLPICERSGAPLETGLWVRLETGGQGDPDGGLFVLRSAQGDLVSSLFPAGPSKTALTWTGAVRAQQIYELSRLELATGDGRPLPPYSESFRFVVGTTVAGTDWPLLTRENVLAWSGDSTFTGVVTQSLPASVSSPSCSATDEDLETLASLALRSAPVNEPFEEAQSEVADDPAATEDELAEEQERLETLEAQLKVSLGSARTSLEKERGLNGKVRSSLNGSVRSSCQAKRPIGTLEIFLVGGHLEDSDWDRKATDIIKESEGQPERITISLGEGLEISHPSESKNPILTSAGYLRTDVFANRLVNEITEIKIKKHGTGYSSEQVCWNILGWSKWGVGKDCEYRNRETHRYTLEGIRLVLDGQAFYESPRLEVGLHGGSTLWQETRLTRSSDYINFMTTNTCKEEKQ